MAKELRDLLSREHEFCGQNEDLKSKIQRRVTETPNDLNELAINVRSILVSAGKACRVSEIENDFRKLFGKRLPVREFGSSNAVELLKRIPEACEISEANGDPLVSVKNTQKTVKFRSKLKSVSVQSAPLKDVFVPFTVQDEMRRILYRRGSIKKNEFLKLLGDKFDLKFMNLEVSVETLIRCLPHIIINDGAYLNSAYQIDKSEIEVPEVLYVEGQHIMPSYRLGYHEFLISQQISALLEEKEQLHVFDIPRLFSKKFGKDLKWNQFGFEDLWRFLQLLPGDFTLFKSDSGYVVAASIIRGTVDTRYFDEKDLCGQTAYKEVVKKVRKLVLYINTGLNSKHFRTAYETLYFEKLLFKTSFDQFLSELQDQHAFKIKEIGGSSILFPCNSYDIHKLEKMQIKEFEEVHQAIDVLKSGECLKSLKFPKVINANNNHFCAACVSFIETPNDFFIRILGMGPDHQMELEENFNILMEEMQQCYLFCPEDYDIPLRDLRLNMVCAANVRGEWQRVEIVDVVSSAQILVMSVDYGRCHKVTLINLKYLSKKFSELPILAYRATLFNIRPAENDWSLEAILKFRRLTVGDNMKPKVLSVVIIYRNEKGPMQVTLSDTYQNKAMHIGEQLVDQGYGLFKFVDDVYIAFYS